MNSLGLMNKALFTHAHPHPENQAKNTQPEQIPSICRYLHHALHLM